MEASKNKGGRPKINLESMSFDGWDHLDSLIIWASEVYCAEHLEINIDTLAARIKERSGLSFSEYKAKKRESVKICLAQKQFETAMSGNPSMQIWLGKQWLGQVDKQEIENKHDTIKIEISDRESKV